MRSHLSVYNSRLIPQLLRDGIVKLKSDKHANLVGFRHIVSVLLVRLSLCVVVRQYGVLNVFFFGGGACSQRSSEKRPLTLRTYVPA